MSRRHCPVCRTGWILRADIKTCSPRCSLEWRNWSAERRTAAEEKASRPLEVLTFEQITKIRNSLVDPAAPVDGAVGAAPSAAPTIEGASDEVEEPDFNSIISGTTKKED